MRGRLRPPFGGAGCLNLRLVRWIAWSLVGVLVVAFAASQIAARLRTSPAPQLDAAGDPIDAGTSMGSTPAPDFTLTDQFGHGRSLADFHGKTVVLAFVDSRGTTTSPLTAQMLTDAQQQLGAAGQNLQLVAVNANPAATSVSDVMAWSQLHGMTAKWLFLTGSAAALQQVYAAYHVYVQVAADGEAEFTDAVFVLDPQGRERYLFTTDPNFSGLVPESTNLARRIASVMPGRVALTPLRTQAAAATGTAQTAAASTAFTLPALLPGGANGQVAVGSTAAGGPRLVDFFATWCTACQQDLRTLAQYSVQAAGKGLPPVVGVDLRVAEPSTEWVAGFLQKANVPFPVALDSSGAVMDAYGVTDLPHMAVVTADGKVLWQHTGSMALDQLSSQVAAAVANH